MQQRTFYRLSLAGAMCFASVTTSTFATDFADVAWDNYGAAYVDLVSASVTNDATNVTFSIQLNPTANLIASDASQIYGKYYIGFQTGDAGSTSVMNPWGNPIGISSATGMDYWLGSWADNSAVEPFSGGAQFYKWNGSAFDLTAGIGRSEPYVDVPIALASTSVTISIPLASLGVAAGDSFKFDIWTTFAQPGGQSAYDALGKQTLTTDPGQPWVSNTPYDSGTSLFTYTVASAVSTSTWTSDSDGNWSDTSKWSAGVPNGIDFGVSLQSAATAPRTITLDSPHTVGTISFDNANRYSIVSASNALTLDVSAGSAAINVVNGSHTIGAPVILADDTSFNVSGAANTLSLTGPLTATGRTLTKTGAGKLQLENARGSSLNISEGSVLIRQKAMNSDASGTSVLANLTIATGASLNLSNNSLAVDYTGSAATALATIRDHLATGRLVGAPAVADTRVALGYADNAVLTRTTFDGQAVTTSSILVGLTLRGDTDLDRNVNFNDLLSLAQSYGLTSGATWQKGDVDYSGTVDFTDLLALAQVYGSSLLSDGTLSTDTSMNFDIDWAMAQSMVPEPMIGGVLMGLVTLARRRR